MDEWLFPMISVDTTGNVEYSSMPLRGPLSAADLTTSLIWSIVVSFLMRTLKSTTDPSGTGTLIAIPSSFPFSSGNTTPTALAAPVVVGITFSAAARLLLQSEWGTSASLWSFV